MVQKRQKNRRTKQKFKFTQKTDSEQRNFWEIIKQKDERSRRREKYVLCMKAHVYEFSHLLLLQAHQRGSSKFLFPTKKNLLYHPPNDICSYSSSNAFLRVLSLDVVTFAPILLEHRFVLPSSHFVPIAQRLQTL